MVDTRDKRFSLIGLTAPTVREQQNPTGTIGAPARAMLLFLYSGIALALPIVAVAKILTLLASVDSPIVLLASPEPAYTLLASVDSPLTLVASS